MKRTALNKFVCYFITVILLFVFAFFILSEPTAIAFVKDVGNKGRVSSSYNISRVRNYCEDYTLYSQSCVDTDVEHIYAQSWPKAESVANDYLNLRIADKSVNSKRGNLGFGDVKHDEENQVKDANGNIAGWKDDRYFEPQDEYKGDVARTLLYVYYNYDLKKEDIKGKFDIKTMIKWAKKDKVDKKEREFQNNVKETEKHGNLFIEKEGIIYLFNFV